MSRYSRADLDCKVYVGNLGETAGRRELEEAFMKYGAVKNVWVARNPPGFAFVEFEEPRDAQDAVNALDETMLCGHRAIVEMSSGEKRNRRGGGGGGGRPPRSAGFDDKCYSCGERGHFARDCKGGGRYGGGGGGGGGGRYGSFGGGGGSGGGRRRSYGGGRRSRSRSRDRSYSPRRYSDRSRSRSRSRRSRDRSYSPRKYSDRSRSRSPSRRSYTPKRHRSRSSSDRD